MDYDDHLRAVRRELDTIDAALRAGPISSPVPSCPDWVVKDLVHHVGSFAGFWGHVLCESGARPKFPFPDMPDASNPEVLADWLKDIGDSLCDEMEATTPDTKIWTWVKEDDTARFAARRAANELAVHRVDLELARGRAEPIAVDLAVDGIDEIFLMIANRGVMSGGSGQTMHLHASDADEHWRVTIDVDEVALEKLAWTDAEGVATDFVLSGSASDVELTLYQRPPLGTLETKGDDRVLDDFYRAFRF